MDVRLIVEEFQNHLAPRLDTYEQVIYLYVFRHSRLQGQTDVVIGFKSARLRMAEGVGQKTAHMSERTCYEKLRSLEQKGCIEIVRTEPGGTRVKLHLPSEIPGLIPQAEVVSALTLEEMDFFAIAVNRALILKRESSKCFYCLRILTATSHVIEHVTSRPVGNNGYRNVVTACLTCNNRKGDLPAEDFLRQLYREDLLSADDFEARNTALQSLRSGLLKPTLSGVRASAA